ncbi:MAG: Cna B-type domain-containing protein, partial [Lachnospiraceae bacterium]|nr:Cna B-type domain-containing protein [Lachnospiraceae bacterium]
MHKLIRKKIFKRVMAGTLAFTLFAGSIGSPGTVSASDGVSAVSSESIVSYDTDLVYPEGDCAGAGEDGAAEEGGSDTVVSADSQTGEATEVTETETVHSEAGTAATDGTESSEATNGAATESSGTMNGMNAGTSGTTDAAGTEQTGQEVTLAGFSETGIAAETELGISMTSEAGGDVSEAEAENTLLTAGESETETETEDADPDGGDCFVGGLSVTSIVDGTAPFDSDDEAGDDSSDSNRIVRSFDYVSYTLSYTTALADEKVSVDSGTLYVEFVLPCSPNIAIFNMDAMNWMVDPKLTYYFADGTTGTGYDDAEDVVKQVLTGYRELTNAASMAIPGAGTLSVGLYVGAAPNGTVVQPSFTLWMKDNKETQKVSVTPDAVTVSAAPKYKVQIKQAVDMNVYGEYDLSTGNENAAQDTVSDASTVRGRMEGYGITVLMENDSVEKGLKGLEFQSGEITFDITLNEYSMNASGVLLSDQTGYTPVMWDYDENVRSSSYGEWGRQFVRLMGFAYNAAPFNVLGCSYSSIYDACYDGGDWSITQDADDPLTYHVTIKDYSVDTENYIFPTRNCDWTTTTSAGTAYKANQACFSAGSIQAVMQFPYGEIGDITNVYFKVTADNFAVNGTAYDTTSSFSNTYTLLPAGSLNTYTNFTNTQAALFSDVDNQLGTSRTNGDAASYRTASVRLWQVIATTTDEAVETKIGLLKWDADAFEVDRTSQYYSTHGRIARGTFTAYFVGRTGNWSSVQEMSDTLMNDSSLHFFSDLDALEAAGYVCVGMLWINDISVSGPGQQEYYGIDLLVKDTAAIGETYAAVSEGWGAYSDVDPMTAGSGSEVLLDIDMIQKYDLYSAYCSIDAYAAMGKTRTTDAYYVKTEYDEDGNIISGTHRSGPYAGTSLLICGEKATVDISIADTGSNGEEKAVYDMDAGERTVTYSVQPYLEVQGNSSTGSEATSGKSTAVVKVTLPEDLTYDEGSSYWGEEAVAPETISNDDGTVTLIYMLADVTVGETLDAITFSCTIGHAGTMDDVVNNQGLTVSATIASTGDNRLKTAVFGNYSSVGLVIVKLMATSISKQVDPRLIEQDGSFTWTFLFANESDESQKSTRLADVLPSDGDSMGSDFSGIYQVDSITIDFSSAKTSFVSDVDSMAFYVTTGTVGESASSLVSQGSSSVSSWKDLMGQASVDRENYTVTINTSGYEDMTAFYFDLGTLASKESLSFTLSVTTDGNEPGDIYCNKFYEYGANQSASVTSVLVSTQVVERNVSGVAWLDADNDGIRADSETLLSGVTAKLYRTSASGNDPSKKSVLTVNGVKLYTAYDVQGDEVPSVTTGKDGSYRFTGLEAGTYYVVFSGKDGYGLAVQDAGEDDTVDSDATASVNSDGSGIEYAYISGLVLPSLDEMYNYLYESAHNDVGFISFTSGLTIRKVAEGTSVGLAGVIFVLKNSDGNYLMFADGSYSGTREKVNADCYLTTGTDGTVTIDGLTYGTYTLSEYQAPDGYQLSKETWKIKVQGRTAESGWESYVTVDGELLDGKLVIENASETTTVTVTKAWKDNSNQDGLRTDVTLTLTGTVTTDTGETETVVTKTGSIRANASKQEYTFTKLPVYSSGLEVTYTVTEEMVAGYETSYSALDGDWENGYSMVVTNTHTTETTEYSAIKVWDDDGNRDGVRPETIEVKLIGSD